MSTVDEKKQQERHLLDRFLNGLPDFRADDIEFSERPDFIIQTGGHRIGVELTRLFQHPINDKARPPQEIESLQNRAVSTAERIHSERGGPTLWVAVFFLDHEGLQVQALAEKIADIVGWVDLGPGERTELSRDWDDDDDDFPDAIEVIHVARITDMEKLRWHSPRAGREMSLRPDDVQTALDSKESKVREYREKCDEVWLLLAAEGYGIASLIEPTDEAKRATYRSSFDRAFLLVNFGGKVTEFIVQESG